MNVTWVHWWISQHWFRLWLGAVITWANVDPDLCRQMNELNPSRLILWFPLNTTWQGFINPSCFIAGESMDQNGLTVLVKWETPKDKPEGDEVPALYFMKECVVGEKVWKMVSAGKTFAMFLNLIFHEKISHYFIYYVFYVYLCSTKLLGGYNVGFSPSRILCLLCSACSSGWIHFIFKHLIKQLQKVCCV